MVALEEGVVLPTDFHDLGFKHWLVEIIGIARICQKEYKGRIPNSIEVLFRRFELGYEGSWRCIDAAWTKSLNFSLEKKKRGKKDDDRLSLE